MSATPEAPRPDEVLAGITRNAAEIRLQIEAVRDNPANAGLFIDGAVDILAGKLAKRILLAGRMGIYEELIVAAIEHAFTGKTADHIS